MKPYQDEAVGEVRNARKALCDRFGNDPRRLLTHLRAEQRRYRGRIIKNWSEMQSADTLRESTEVKKHAPKVRKPPTSKH